MPVKGKFGILKLIVAGMLVFGSLFFIYAQYRKYRPAPPPPRSPMTSNPQESPQTRGNIFPVFSKEEREKMRTEIYAQLNPTPEQAKKMDEITKRYEGQFTPESLSKRIEEYSRVLSPAQREKMKDVRKQMAGRIESRIRSHIMERARTLPENEKKILMEKFDERRAEMQKRMDEWEQGRENRISDSEKPAQSAP